MSRGTKLTVCCGVIAALLALCALYLARGWESLALLALLLTALQAAVCGTLLYFLHWAPRHN